MRILNYLITPPQFKDEGKTYQAYLLNIILLALITVPIPFIIYLLIWKPGELYRTLIFIAVAEIINITLLVMLKRGFVRQVAIVHIITLWSIFAVSSATRSGIYAAPYTLGNGLVITVAGILLGKRSAQAVTWLVIAQGGIMIYAEFHGWNPSYIASDPIYTLAVAIVLFAILVNLQTLASNQIYTALARAQTSEARYRLISQVSSDYTFSTELDSKGAMYLSWVAGAFEKITGFTFEEYVASGGWLAHLHPDDVQKDAHDMAILRTNQAVVTEIRAFKKNGELSWVRVYSHPIWDEKQNKLTGLVGAVQDITQQKLGEVALTHERDLLQMFMDNIPDQVYFKDTQSRFVRINKAQANFLKLNTPQDAIGKTDMDFFAPELAQQFLDEERQILASGQPVINRIEFNPAEDKKPRWITATKVPVRDSSGNLLGTIGISRDITEQKLTDAMLAYERDILQIFMDNIPDQIYFKDIESRFVRINQGQALFLGIDNPQDAIGKTDLDFQPSELAQEFLAEEKQVIETGQPVLNRIEFNPTKDGKPRWLSTSKVPAKNELGQVIGTIGMSTDVTDQKLADEREENRRKMLEKVLELGKNVTEVTDIKTTVERIWHGVHDGLDFDRMAIFFYDTESNSVGRILGTNKHGDMEDSPVLWFSMDEWSTFKHILNKPDGFYITENFDIEHNIPENHEMYGVKGYAAVAVWAGNKPVAVITVDQFLTQRPITEQQLEALRLFAGYAGLAIENSRLREAIQNELVEQKRAEETEQRRRVMLEKIVKLGQYVTEVQDLRTTLQRIWYTVRNELDFDRLGIYLYNPDNNIMNGSYGTGDKGEILEEWDAQVSLTSENIERNAFWKALQEPNGVYITHNYEVEHDIPKGHVMYGVRDFAAVAAWAGNKPIAVMCVDQHTTQRSITDSQLEMMRLFAGYAGLAIENSRLKDAIQNELNEKKQAEEAEQRRRQMLEKVVQLGKQVTEVSELKTTLEKIWRALHEGLSFDRIGIFSYQTESNSISRMLGTDIQGNRDDTPGESVPISQWHAFQNALEKPDGYYFTHEFSREATIPEGEEMYEVKDYAAVAAWAGGKPVAVITVDQLITQRPITEQQLEALRLFAGYAGLAIENARLKDAIQNELMEQKQAEENEQRRRLMMEKVIQLGKQVTAVSDFRATLQKIWHIVRYDLDFDRAGLFLYNPEDATYDGAYGTDHEGNIWDAWHVKVGVENNTPFEKSMVFSKVLGHPDGFYFTKDYESEFSIEPNEQMAGVKYYAVVALWSGNKPIAIISVDQLVTGRAFTDEQLEALRLFAGYAGFAIENSRLKETILSELAEQKQLEENEQHRRITLEKVIKLGQQVTEVSDLRTTLRKIWHGVRYDLDFDRVGLFTYNSQENMMVGAYGTDSEGNIWDAWHVKFGLDDNALFYKVLSRPDGFFLTKDFAKELKLPPDHDMIGVKYAALVAVWAGNKPMAIISVDQLVTQRPITDDQLEALRLFAGYAGLAISNSKLNDALEGELSQRQTFITELEDKNAELERFTYTASHDLKSPLVTITGFLGYLEKDALAGNQERMKSSIARINSAAEKMQALLNDLLELSRIGRMMNPPQDVPFNEIVHEAIDRVRGRLDEVNAVVEVQRDFPTVRCDRVRLVEVAQNLIENAVKYAKPNSIPHIEVGSSGASEDGQSIFHVRDDGIGIDPQYHERIFGLFNKLDAQSEGTGIGLSLVKRIIEVHGGRVWVESEKNMGATFYFSLPTSQTKE